MVLNRTTSDRRKDVRPCLLILAVTLLVASVALTRQTSAAPAKATPETLKRLEAEFMQAAAEKGSQGYMWYYADDAVEIPNGHAAIQSKSEIAKTMGFLDDKNNRLTWTPMGVQVRRLFLSSRKPMVF